MGEFEQWFADQDFYMNMRFIHGDNLFSKDGDVYLVLPVQMTYVAFGEKHAEYAEAKQVGIALNTETINQRRYIGSQQSKIEQLEKKISTFKERIENAEKFINQIPCQSTWEAESRQDAMKALRNGKKFKEPKKLPHTHIFISNTCECGWTIDQEKTFRGEHENQD